MAGSDARVESWDAIVIGTGQAGKPLARALGRAGKRTAVIERDHVGGSCINVGCTPTKTLVATARVAYLARRARDFGVQVDGVRVDVPAAMARKRSVVERFRDGSRRGLEKTPGVSLLFGEASFEGAHRVRVRLRDGGERILEAPWIFINTGCRPRIPDLPGLDTVPYLDSTSIMELEDLPEHLVVLGGGYVGLEFGQMFRRFGSRVTLLQRRSQVLPREDEDIAAALTDILRDEGVDVRLNARAMRVEPRDGGGVAVTVDSGGAAETLEGSHLLVAAGRVPNTESLELHRAGIETDPRGYIRVNDALETGVEGVWALGDVKGGPAFTHISYDDFRVIRARLLEGRDATIAGRLVPYTVFTDPQLGRVGLSEREAREQGLEVRVATLPMAHVARAIESSETRGLMKAVVEPEGRILGCAILGMEGGEIMAVLQTAMMGGLPYTRIRDAVYAHPTLAESLNNLFMTLDG